MFEVKFYVKDKDMGELLKRVSNIALDIEHHYVPNLESKPNGRKVYQTAADTIELLTSELHKRKLTQITGPEMKKLVEYVKLNPVSASHYTQSLLIAGVLKKLKKVKNTMIYSVTGK